MCRKATGHFSLGGSLYVMNEYAIYNHSASSRTSSCASHNFAANNQYTQSIVIYLESMESKLIHTNHLTLFSGRRRHGGTPLHGQSLFRVFFYNARQGNEHLAYATVGCDHIPIPHLVPTNQFYSICRGLWLSTWI